MKKRILCLALVMVMIFTLLPMSAFAAETVSSGTCGENLTWTLDSEGTLTISGTGNMNDYSVELVNEKYITTAPWGEYYDTIKSVVIEAGVTSIGDYAFCNCSSLASVTIPDSVRSIGDHAFSGCSRLTSVTIPDGVTSIGEWAFSGCSRLTSVTIPDGVTSISNYAFYNCGSLTSVTIPDSVTSIGYDAFRGCSSLTSVTIPHGVTSISNDAFFNCSSLTSVTIGNSVTSIGDNAFGGCSKIKVVNYDGNIESWLGIDFADYGSNPCTNGSNLYFKGELVTNAVIPDSITRIKNRSFYNCSSLTSVTIPDSVTSIGDYAFYNCSSLTSVTIPNSVTSIGSSAFEGCSSLASVTIPDSVTSIGYRAFARCSSLASVTIPNSVTSIGISAFYGCSSLTSVTISHGVTSISNDAFSDCSSLTSVTIPDSVTSIGHYAFGGCSKLKDIAFAGSKDAWASIEKSDAAFSTSPRIHYNCTTLDGHIIPIEIKDPNCTSTGYIKYSCACGYEYTKLLPQSHDYVFIVSVAATCSNAGYDVYKCSKCGKILNKSNGEELLPHDYVVTVVEPTCLKGGYTLHKCSVCGDEYKDNLTALLGHSMVEVGEKPATCTEAGHTAGVQCSLCGLVESGVTEIPALGHSYGNWTQTKAPTCTAKGVETRYCSRCDVTETRDVDALGHDLVHHDGTAATCTEKGWEAYDTCSRCDYTTYKEISALGHDYKDGVCTVCGAKDPDYEPPVVKENPFVDVSESSVYYDAILWAYYHEPQQITGGYTATEFCPGNPCTRGQVVTFLWRAAGCPEPTGNINVFNDASSIAAPYQKAVAWAVENGITTGFTDGSFRPNDSVTRAQFVTFLWRYEGKPATSGSIAGFTDAASIASPYQQAVAWAVEKGITTGYNDGSFRPNATCTRWAVVLFMYRDMK